MPPRLVLASASPRRLTLLATLGIVPDRIIDPSIDETPLPAELPRLLAARLARAKAAAGARTAAPGEFVLAADTVVALGRRPLPGVTHAAGARDCLQKLSGRTHRVFTAVVLLAPDGTLSERLSESHVSFARLSSDQLDRYLASGEWLGKAGGYAIQGLAASFVRTFHGSHSGVVGLPIFETAQLLRGKGWRVP